MKGEPVARAETEDEKVDWTKSAAFRDLGTAKPVLTQQDLTRSSTTCAGLTDAPGAMICSDTSFLISLYGTFWSFDGRQRTLAAA